MSTSVSHLSEMDVDIRNGHKIKYQLYHSQQTTFQQSSNNMIKMERILTCKRTTLKRIAFRGNQSSAGQKQHQYGMSLEQLQAGPLLGP